MNSGNSLLSEKDKIKIKNLISSRNLSEIIKILEKVKTSHANTAKTKDKRFVIREIVREIIDSGKDTGKDYFQTGLFFCRRKEDNAKEIGISLIWRGYKQNPGKVKEFLLKTADDQNWEVREYAGSAFADTLFYNREFYKDLIEWTKHPTENVRRAVVFSALGMRDEKNLNKAFRILRSLMNDRSIYVRKNLGPFILGSYFGNKFPEETTAFLHNCLNDRDLYVRWNVIMSFNNSFGKKYPGKAFEILKYFYDDENLVVIRAMRSTLKFLRRHHRKVTDEFIKKYYKDKFNLAELNL
ncbi:MAG: HEAT repeat domain-containing protein [Bacteroidetes bacterium]|nr:HEAT repeat domain-containing protein [Bacteroidota bacterium]